MQLPAGLLHSNPVIMLSIHLKISKQASTPSCSQHLKTERFLRVFWRLNFNVLPNMSPYPFRPFRLPFNDLVALAS
jgi:hypothetical protein